MSTYAAMTPAEIDAVTFENRIEIGCEGIERGEVAGALESGRAVLVCRPFGFALIELQPSPLDGQPIPHLWVLYISPESRGQGHGQRFLRELVQLHAQEYHMSLYCHGARRRRFFGRAGFRVESRDGEWRRMTTNR